MAGNLWCARALMLALLTPAAAPAVGWAQERPAVAGVTEIRTGHSFDVLAERLERAVEDNGMAVVTRASASRGAASRGLQIAGNLVVGVFRNDFAVRMLAASVPAGIEAPLRFYVTENADGTSNLAYRVPSVVFAAYGSRELDAMAAELDQIWENIAAAATAG